MTNEGKIIFKELSYKILGCCFDVYNSIGFGFRESVYQKALEEDFTIKKIPFDSQVYAPVIFREKTVGKHYIDLVIDGKIVLELKVGDHFLTKDIKQIYSYLVAKNLKLGIIVNFTSKGIKHKRILNLDPN